ncbi:MAG: hypothetical protein AAF642_01445 [Pseudomonadota bacterium]
MTSTHQSRGFVTASMSLLLFGLSIITMAFLAFAMNEHAATQRTIDQIDIDNAFDAVFVKTLTQMLETGDLRTNERRTIGRANRQYTFRAIATDEAVKQDILRAPTVEIEDALDTYLQDGDARRLLRDAVLTARNRIGSHAEVFNRARHSGALDAASWWCFSHHFTYFQPPNRIRRSNSDRSLQGQMFAIQISAQHEGKTERVLDTVVLLTGQDAAPYWIYRWEKYLGAEAGDCTNDSRG